MTGIALATTGYILIALRFEEADLVRAHGNVYRDYQARVPMLIPIPKGDVPQTVRDGSAA